MCIRDRSCDYLLDVTPGATFEITFRIETNPSTSIGTLNNGMALVQGL